MLFGIMFFVYECLSPETSFLFGLYVDVVSFKFLAPFKFKSTFRQI